MSEIEYPAIGYGLAVALDEGTGSYNYAVLKESGAGQPVVVAAEGLDDNISITFQPKGAGTVDFGAFSFATINVAGLSTLGSASANYVTIAGAASGAYPTWTALGSDANIDLRAVGKGTGYFNTTKLFVGSAGVRPLITTATTVYLRTSTAYSSNNPASLFVGGLYTGTGAGDVQLMTFLAEDSVIGGSTMFRVHHVLKTGATGGHTAVADGLTIAEPVDGGAGTNFQVAHGAITRVTATHSGIVGDAKGNLFARNAIMVAGNGAGGHVISVIGDEVDTTISARVRVLYHIGVSSVLHRDGTGGHNHEARGLLQDTAFSIGSAGNNFATVGWRIGVGVGSPTGWAMDPDSRLIATEPVGPTFAPASRPYTLADVIDMTGLAAINRSLYITNNAALDGNGNSGAQVAAGVSLQTRSAITAKTAVVATLTALLPDGGGLYTASGTPTVTIAAPPGSGTTATATIATHAGQQINSMSNGGTGYAVDQILTQSGGTFFTVTENCATTASSTSITAPPNSIPDGTIVIGAGIPINTRVASGGGTTTLILTNAATATSGSVSLLFNAQAQVRVLRVDVDGKVRELLPETGGNYSILPIGEQTYTGGTGAGMICSLLYTARTFNAGGAAGTNAGSNYPEFPAPVARYTGGVVLRQPVIVVTMTATQTRLQLNSGLLNLTGIPTSSAGLAAGDVWSNSGVLTVV